MNENHDTVLKRLAAQRRQQPLDETDAGLSTEQKPLVGPDCLNDGQLRLLRNGALDEAQEAGLALHLNHCAACMDRLITLELGPQPQTSDARVNAILRQTVKHWSAETQAQTEVQTDAQASTGWRQWWASLQAWMAPYSWQWRGAVLAAVVVMLWVVVRPQPSTESLPPYVFSVSGQMAEVRGADIREDLLQSGHVQQGLRFAQDGILRLKASPEGLKRGAPRAWIFLGAASGSDSVRLKKVETGVSITQDPSTGLLEAQLILRPLLLQPGSYQVWMVLTSQGEELPDEWDPGDARWQQYPRAGVQFEYTF